MDRDKGKIPSSSNILSSLVGRERGMKRFLSKFEIH